MTKTGGNKKGVGEKGATREGDSAVQEGDLSADSTIAVGLGGRRGRGRVAGVELSWEVLELRLLLEDDELDAANMRKKQVFFKKEGYTYRVIHTVCEQPVDCRSYRFCQDTARRRSGRPCCGKSRKCQC